MGQPPLTNRILDALNRVLGPARETVPLHEPWFNGNEWAYVKDCLDTGWVSSAGGYVSRFEAALTEYTGAGGAVAVVNGTCGLTAALALAGVKPGHEVLVPSLTFAATANAAAHLGAVPHFIDVEPTTLGMDPATLRAHLKQIAERQDGMLVNTETGTPISALVVVHVFGHPADLEGLKAVADEFRLPLIEDAAEGLGSFRHETHVGLAGQAGVLSFNGNKTLTTGGGGALLFASAEDADRARHLTNTAKRPHPWTYFHDRAGYNFRMPNINAALGLAQIEQLDHVLSRKRNLAERYATAFKDLDGTRFQVEPEGCRSNHWLNALLLDDPAELEPVLEAVNAAGYQVRPVWIPSHLLPMYKQCPRTTMAVTEDLAGRIVNLPSGPKL